MSNYTLYTLETDIQEMVKDQVAAYVKLVTSYSGTAVDAINNNKTMNLPAVLIQLDRISYEFDATYGSLPATFVKTYRFNIYVVASHYKSEKRQRRQADKGAYALIEDVEKALLGKRITDSSGTYLSGVMPVVCTEVSEMSAGQDKVVYRMSFEFDNVWDVNG